MKGCRCSVAAEVTGAAAARAERAELKAREVKAIKERWRAIAISLWKVA